jgi:copper homeostasis protein
MDVLAELVKQADARIIIMPGAGVRSSNIEQLMNETGATEYHTSARKAIELNSTYKNPDVLDTGKFYLADEDELRKIIVSLNR